jgi:hypothetical protein
LHRGKTTSSSQAGNGGRSSWSPRRATSQLPFHRSLDPFARFRYINVAVWETSADFYAAFDHPRFLAMREATPFTHYPSFYEVIRT